MPKKSRTRKIIALLAYIEYYSVKEFTTSSAFHIYIYIYIYIYIIYIYIYIYIGYRLVGR